MAFHPVDVHVGSRVRLRRKLLDMSQEKLGNAVNLTFQQVQKYERGANRISASRIYQFSLLLDVPISFFFDGLPASAGATALEPVPRTEDDIQLEKETKALVDTYYSIRNKRIRSMVRDIIRNAAGIKNTRKRRST